MSTITIDSRRSAAGVAEPDPRRWQALAVLAAMQFMLTLDVTVVTVALPKIQHDLLFSHAGLAWVLNGYVLMAGGFLLLGGRLADMFGRRRLFVTGVVVFGVTSALCGAAVTSSMLVTSRFLQGTGEALAGPAALGMIPVLFPDSRERMKAVGVWGGIAALGGTFGTVLSGALTNVDWRWIFYINIPVVLFALLMVPRVLPENRMARESNRIDVPGAVTATGGLVAIVYGLLQAASHPWGSWQVLVPLLGGIALLLIMIGWEARSPDPIIPLRFFTNRTRVTSNVVSLTLFAPFYGYVVLLTWYMQQVLGYSPLKTGLLWLPLGVGIGAGMGVCTWLMPRIGVKAVLSVGLLGSAGGLRPGLRGADRHAADRRGAGPGHPGHARTAVRRRPDRCRHGPVGRAHPRIRPSVPRRGRRARLRRRARPGAAGESGRHAAHRPRRGPRRPRPSTSVQSTKSPVRREIGK